MLPNDYLFAPSVFAVGDKYLICVALGVEATVAVEIGDETYYDSSNGILRSKKYLHMVEIPMEELNRAKEYTVITREYTERLPYFPKTREPISHTVKFRPLCDKKDIKLTFISDTHGRTESPIKAGAYFGKELDLLVLGGDIADHSGSVENFKTLYNLAGSITGGEVPCIFARGNHDLRGECAEILADYTPTDNGKSFYTVKLGPIWAIILDCGEDKSDDHAEYGYSVACHSFRQAETRFIKNVIKNKEKEYEDENVKHKLLLSHVPFAQRYEDPFNPEEEIYTEWCRLCREEIAPDLWIAGHKHIAEIARVGGERDQFGQPCDCVIGSRPNFPENTFICANIVLAEGASKVIFSNEKGEVVLTETVTR